MWSYQQTADARNNIADAIERATKGSCAATNNSTHEPAALRDFNSAFCPLWVNRVGSAQPTASPDVRFTSNSFRRFPREVTAVLVAGAATERHVDPPPCFARGW